MKNKKELIPYEGKKVIPISKKIISTKTKSILIFSIIVVLVLSFYIIYITNPSTKAKRYLTNNGYVCNKQTCTKDIGNNIYTFNYKLLTYNVDTDFYYVNINDESPSLTLKDDEYVCTFTKDNYKRFTLVDNTFVYNKICEKYIEKVNSHIKEYKQIIEESNINVNS